MEAKIGVISTYIMTKTIVNLVYVLVVTHVINGVVGHQFGHGIHVQVGIGPPRGYRVQIWTKSTLAGFIAMFMWEFCYISIILSLCTRSHTRCKRGRRQPITTWHTCMSWSWSPQITHVLHLDWWPTTPFIMCVTTST